MGIYTFKNTLESCTITLFRDKKLKNNFWGGGTAPSPDPTPSGEGHPPTPTPVGAYSASILGLTALDTPFRKSRIRHCAKSLALNSIEYHWI